MDKISVHGPTSDVTILRNDLLSQYGDELIGDIQSELRDPLERPDLGMEPLVYFVVATAAHVTAEAIKEAVQQLNAKRNAHIVVKHDMQGKDEDKENRPD